MGFSKTSRGGSIRKKSSEVRIHQREVGCLRLEWISWEKVFGIRRRVAGTEEDRQLAMHTQCAMKLVLSQFTKIFSVIDLSG